MNRERYPSSATGSGEQANARDGNRRARGGKAGITKQSAQAAAGAVFASIGEALVCGEDDPIFRFGRFSRKDRAGRQRRNPRTGAHHAGAVDRCFVQGR